MRISIIVQEMYFEIRQKLSDGLYYSTNGLNYYMNATSTSAWIQAHNGLDTECKNKKQMLPPRP